MGIVQHFSIRDNIAKVVDRRRFRSIVLVLTRELNCLTRTSASPRLLAGSIEELDLYRRQVLHHKVWCWNIFYGKRSWPELIEKRLLLILLIDSIDLIFIDEANFYNIFKDQDAALLYSEVKLTFADYLFSNQ